MNALRCKLLPTIIDTIIIIILVVIVIIIVILIIKDGWPVLAL